MASEAFVENTEDQTPVVYVRNLKLPMNEDGTIDWDSAPDKHKKAFIQAIQNDPSGILANIQEEAGEQSSETAISDSTVLTLTNAIFMIEGVGFSLVGRRFVPVLKHLHPLVAIKACTVTRDELEPVMEPAKRIVARFMPPNLLQYQDLIVVGEYFVRLSAIKFKACIDLAVQIQKLTAGGIPDKANGHAGNVVVEP